MRMKISVGSEIIVVLQGSFRGATHSIQSKVQDT